MKQLLIGLIFLLCVGIALAAPSEMFVTGVFRNTTTGLPIDGYYNIGINITNSSDQLYVYQTKNTQLINDGVLHTTFTSIQHSWFLDPGIKFGLVIGTDYMGENTLVPVPIAHAAWVANSSRYIGDKTLAQIEQSIINNASAAVYTTYDNLQDNLTELRAGMYDETNLTADTSGWDTNVNDDWNLANLTAKYPNLDTDSTDDLAVTDGGLWKLINMTPYAKHTDVTLNITAGFSSAWDMANMTDFAKHTDVTLNITAHAASAWNLGNYSAINQTCPEITGSADLCDGDDADSQLTEDQVEAFIFDEDNTENFNVTIYNITTSHSNLYYFNGSCNIINGPAGSSSYIAIC